MRSTNIILFLVALNGAAFLVGATLGPAFGIAPQVGGDAQIDSAQGDADESLQSSRTGVGEFVSATFMVADLVRSIDNIVFAGPNMLINLGAPGILINSFKGILVFVVSIDVAEVLSGRSLT
jgi:hypothetical protein